MGKGAHAEAIAAFAQGLAVDPTNATLTASLVEAQQAAAKAAAGAHAADHHHITTKMGDVAIAGSPTADAPAAATATATGGAGTSSSSSSSAAPAVATEIIGIDL